jgi:serine/threonine-protein kinase
MATVYLAQDLRHDRKVALKVLRTDLAAVIGAERFLQEIRTTANLQHPHILPLHDSGQVDGTVFYVMPFIDGESLRDRLTRDKQLPVEDALRFAREVADALGYAHERGIIHRDIKPENILLQRGHALVADFGIALAASRTGGSRMTETGLSLGTPHYMSPEQAMGERELGPRSDVYALGCVCYEMLCGEPPFTGPTPQAIVARVMTEPPRSVRSQRPTVPENVEAAVLQALEKLPADRFGSAGAFAEALGQPSFTRTTIAARPAQSPGRPAPWKPLALGLAGAAALLLVALVFALQRPAAADEVPRPVVRFEVMVPDSIEVEQVLLTPDGTRMVVQAVDRWYLYSFATMQWSPFPFPDAKGTASFAVSPDSRWVAFIGDGLRLTVVPLSGGNSRTITDSLRMVNWESDGFLYLVRRTDRRDRVVRVKPEAGALEELLVADSGRTISLGPLLPGAQLLYTVSAGGKEEAHFALDLEDRSSRPAFLPPRFGPFAYAATGHLILYASDGVFAQPFDPKRLAPTGSSVRLVPVLPLGVSVAGGMFAYNLTPPGGPALFNRRGDRRELPGIIAPNSWGFGPSVSPSGHAVAFWRYQAAGDRWDVFTYRLPAGPPVRLTSDSVGYNVGLAWAPDGESVRFRSRRNGRFSLFHAPWDGSGQPEPFLSRPGNIHGVASPGGSAMAVVVDEEGRGLVLVTPGGTDSAIVLESAVSTPRFPRISPDGRWLAYSAVELGRREVFVRPLAGGSRRWKISREGGNNPAWARSGRELFFYVNDSIRAVPVTPGPAFQAGEPRALFRIADLPDFSGFDILPGDSLFVVSATSLGERRRILVTANFLEELRALSAIAQPGRQP